MDELYIIALLNIPKVTRNIAAQIINLKKSKPSSFEDFKEILYMAKKHIKGMPQVSDEIIKLAFYKAHEILNLSEKRNIIAIGRNNIKFPKKLLNIPNAPLMLYVKGGIKCLSNKPSAAVIGTRKPSTLGENSAKSFGYELGKRGIAVISGLAVGCDTNAHEGALASKGYTIAVLGNGLDSIYPKQNTELADKILEMNGCLISEYPAGESVKRSHLVERDRLQSGLSDGIVVVETGITGGTMHTVNFAIKQGKLLAALKYPNEFSQYKNENLSKVDLEKISGNLKLILEEKCMQIYDNKSLENFILKLLENQVSANISQVSFF